MVDKKDKKKKAKKTVTQKQKQKQSVVVNVNMSKPATRRRTLAKKTHDNRPLPPTPQAYGIPVQQSVQPSLNNITEYLKQKEGQENNRHVNILSAMRAIQRDEGQQGGRVSGGIDRKYATFNVGFYVCIYEIKWIAIVNVVWCAAIGVCACMCGCSVRPCVRPCLPKESVSGFEF